MNVLKRLTELLEANNYSVPQIAKEAGITASTIYSWYERQTKNIGIESLLKICNALGITLAQFFEGVSE